MTWYGISVTMVMANRWLFHDWQGKGFPFPVLTTMCHMYLKLAFTRVIFRCKVSLLSFNTYNGGDYIYKYYPALC